MEWISYCNELRDHFQFNFLQKIHGSISVTRVRGEKHLFIYCSEFLLIYRSEAIFSISAILGEILVGMISFQ